MPRPLDRLAELSRALPDAVARGEITAVFQPQFLLATARVVSAEALSRWRHPTLGAVLPDEFIPIAEESGFITEIGDTMIELACRAVEVWQRVTPSVEVAINISLLQLRQRDFAARFIRLVDAASVDIRTLIVEVTESTRAEDVPAAAQNLRDLADAGVTISIDDFGSGFSTEEQAAALPATELKVDLRLVQDESPEGGDRLADAIRFGRALSMRIVAEGVETTTQLARAKALGCDRVQGFLLGHPVSSRQMGFRLAAGG